MASSQTLNTLVGASPLDADDTSELLFTADTDAEVLSRTISDVNSNFISMEAGLTWTVIWSTNISGGDDSIGLSMRVMASDGTTVLAAADSAGTYVTVKASDATRSTADTTSSATFAYVNTSATEADWNGASVYLQQHVTRAMGADGVRMEVDYVAFNGTYQGEDPPASSPTPTLTPSYTSMLIEWTAIVDATSYRIQRSLDGVTGWTVITTTTDLSYTDTGLAYSTTYHYRIEARNAAGGAGYGTSASATTLAEPTNKAALPALKPNSTIQKQWTGNGHLDVDEGMAAPDGTYIESFGGNVDKYDIEATPADFESMWTCSINFRYEIQGLDSSFTAKITASDETTILAAADSSGTYQVLASGAATVGFVNKLTAFGYVNDAATKTQWDGAILWLNSSTLELGDVQRVDTIQIEGEYLTTSTGTTIAVGQATETDTAQAITQKKVALVGQATETDTSQAVTAKKTIAVGQAAETDTATAVSSLKSTPVAQATETDTAQAVSILKTVHVGQAVETDTAQAVSKVKVATVGQASEADSATAVSHSKTVQVSQASETDTALAVTPALAGAIEVVVGQATETDTAGAVSASKSVTVAQAVETSTAQAIGRAKASSVAQALETDAAGTVAPERTHAIGQASEADTATAVSHSKTVHVGQALETDEALTISTSSSTPIGQATETDEARPVTALRTKVVGQAVETDEAQAVSSSKTVAVGQAVETDTATAVSFQKGTALGQAVETDTALAITAAKTVHVGQAQETSTVPAVTAAKTVAVGIAEEVQAATTVRPVRSVLVTQATETESPTAITAHKAMAIGIAEEVDEALVILAMKPGTSLRIRMDSLEPDGSVTTSRDAPATSSAEPGRAVSTTRPNLGATVAVKSYPQTTTRDSS